MTELIHQPGFRDKARSIEILAIDFDGVMTDNRVYVFEDGREAVVCSRLEGYGLRRAAASLRSTTAAGATTSPSHRPVRRC